MTEEVYRIEIPIQTVDNTEPALGQAQNKISKFERSMARTEEQINRMNRTKLQLIASAIDKASGVLGSVASKAKAFAGKTYRISVSVIDHVTKPLRSIANFMTSTIGMVTAGAGVAGGIVIPMNISGNFEQTQIAFETMLKSSEKAKKFLQDAEDFADKTPFEFPELINSSKLLLAFGFDAQRVMGMMRTIGDTSSGLGAGAEGIERMTRALGQMKAKGRVQAEEMLQLQELGVPAAQILQEELGLTAEQVAEIGKQGLESGKVIDALLRGMDKRFGGMMDKQSKSALGMLSTIQDTIKNKFLRRWGEGLWDGFKPQLSKIVDWLDKNEDKVKQWGESFREVGMQISTWVSGKLETVQRNIRSLVSSSEWKEAKTLGEKMKLAWDKVISEPFEEWWNGPGRGKIVSIAESIGRGLGGALGGFISAALGIAADPDKVAKESPFVQAGATAGGAFLNAFLDAFDANKISEKAVDAFKGLGKNALKIAPGGEKATGSSWLSAILLAVGGYKLGKGAYKLGKGGFNAYKGVKGLFKGSKVVDVADDVVKATGITKTAAGVSSSTKTVDAVVNTTDNLKEAAKAFRNAANASKDAENAIKSAEALKSVKQSNLDEAVKTYKTLQKQASSAGEEISKSLATKLNKAKSAVNTSRADVIKAAKEVDNLKSISKVKQLDYSKARDVFKSARTVSNTAKAADVVADTSKVAGKTGIFSKIGSLFGKYGDDVAKTASKGSKGIPILGTAIGLLGSGAVIASASPEDRGKEAAGEAGSWIGSIAGGAGAGALVGTLGGGPIGTAIGGVVGGIGGAIGGEAFTEWLYGQKDAVAAWGKDVGKWFGDTWSGIKTGASDAGSWISSKFNDAKTGVQDKWNDVSGWFNSNVGTPVKNGFIDATNFTVGVFDMAREGVQNAWAPVGSWLDTNVWTPINNGAQAAGEWVGQKFDEAKSWCQNTWSTASGWFDENVWLPVQNAAATAGSWIGQKFDEAKTWASNTWSTVSGWFDENIWSPVKNAASDAGLWIGQKFDEAKSWSQNTWIAASGWFEENVWTPVKNGAQAAADWIGQKFSEAKSWAQEKWSGFTGWFSENISQPVSDFANKAIERGSKITGVRPHAVGGIMTSPHMGLVAEAGPEAIIPLSNSKRSRGIDLWRQVGSILGFGTATSGVLAYANGGIVGNLGQAPAWNLNYPGDDSDDGSRSQVPVMAAPGGYAPTGVTVKVELSNNPTFKIESAADENAILSVIRANQGELADQFSEEIANNLKGIFQNMPKKGE